MVFYLKRQFGKGLVVTVRLEDGSYPNPFCPHFSVLMVPSTRPSNKVSCPSIINAMMVRNLAFLFDSFFNAVNSLFMLASDLCFRPHIVRYIPWRTIEGLHFQASVVGKAVAVVPFIHESGLCRAFPSKESAVSGISSWQTQFGQCLYVESPVKFNLHFSHFVLVVCCKTSSFIALLYISFKNTIFLFIYVAFSSHTSKKTKFAI